MSASWVATPSGIPAASVAEERSPNLPGFHFDSARQVDLLLESLETFTNAVERDQSVSLGEVRKGA